MNRNTCVINFLLGFLPLANSKIYKMKTKFSGILTLLLALVVQLTFAQQKTITGTVTDDTGLPLPGANVIIKGTNSGTQSDFDGNFSISASVGQTLTFSYVGFDTQEAKVGAASQINVTLNQGAVLSEIVLTGYGGNKAKRATTGSVVELSAKEIQDVPVTNVAQALQGKVAGLQSISGSGQPGSSTTVRIRGRGSIQGNTEPLYIIDGIPLNTVVSAAGPDPTLKSSLTQINQADIESITVLKDASSTSIYGSRGANGVIIITTKRGKMNSKTVFDVSTQVGVSSRASKRTMLNAAQYLELSREGAINTGRTPEQAAQIFPDTGVDTDWQKLGFGNGAITRTINASARGGSEKISYYTSIGVEEHDGLALGSYLDKLSGKLSLDNKVSDRVKISLNASGVRTSQGTPGTDAAYFNGPVTGAYLLPPTEAPYNEDGTPRQAAAFTNEASFLAVDAYDTDKFITYRFLGDASATIGITDDLDFTTKWGVDLQFADRTQYNSPLSKGNTAFGKGRAIKDMSDAYLYNITNLLTYTKRFGDKHDFSAIIGQESTEFETENIYSSSEDFATYLLTTLVSGATPIEAYSYNASYSIASYFANVNYGFDGKYYLNGTVRRDGSSRFGDDHKYGTFWAVGGNWNVTNEEFANDSSWLNNLKIRASYGIQGNQPNDYYGSLAQLASGYDYNGNPGQYEVQVANPNLKWEEQNLLEVGVDFRIFDRLYSEVSYYERKTNDLILDVPLSYLGGDTDNVAAQNFGAMENKGFEIKLGVDVIKTDDFFWNVEGNISFNKNKITKLVEEYPEGTKIRREGEAYDSFYMAEWAGVNPENGNPQWLDENNEITEDYAVADAARRIVGTAEPKYFGGLSTTLEYKGFSLSGLLAFSEGGKIYNQTRRLIESDGAFANANQAIEQLDRWQNPGDITNVPRRVNGGNANSNQMSTRWLEDGSYIRLRNATLAYDVPSNLLEPIGLSSLRIYAQGLNILTWTDFTDDPEQAVQGNSWFVYPNAKTYAVGVNLTF